MTRTKRCFLFVLVCLLSFVVYGSRAFLVVRARDSAAFPRTSETGVTSNDDRGERHRPLPLAGSTKRGASYHQRRWEGKFDDLKAYKKKHGDTLVPPSYKKKDPSLYWWVVRQRKLYKKGDLTKDRIQALNSISFTWNDQKIWDEKIKELTSYKEKFGTANISSTDKEYPSLAQWVEYLRKRQTRIPSERRAQLDELGFTWTEPHTEKYDRRWEEMFQRLLAYKDEHGDTLVPVQWEQDKTLGTWVQGQRQRYWSGLLKEDRMQKLNSVRFVWRVNAKSERHSPKWEELWKRRYQELVCFKEQHGHARIPALYSLNQPLAIWVDFQRDMHSIGKMREDRKRLLDMIGFDWDFQDFRGALWTKQLNKWKEYQNTDNATMDSSLVGWRGKQWLQYEKGTLDKKRLALLNEIGFFSSNTVDLRRST